MITDKILGKELFLRVYQDYEKSVKKEIKLTRESLKAPYKRQGYIRDWLEKTWSFTSKREQLKWYLSTKLRGSWDKPKGSTFGFFETMIGSRGKKYYNILRGLKSWRERDAAVEGYIVTLDGKLLKQIYDSHQDQLKDSTPQEILPKFFEPKEIGVLIEVEWTLDQEEKPQEFPENYIPSADEIWAEYLGQQEKKKEPEKKHPGKKIIFLCSTGLFLGYRIDSYQVILKHHLSEENLDPNAQNEYSKILYPIYVSQNPELFKPEVYQSSIDYIQSMPDKEKDSEVRFYYRLKE